MNTETIEDILRELREAEMHAAGGVVPVNPRNLADRIEQSVTNCNQLKMRKALLKSRKAMDEMSMSIFQGWIEDSLADVAGEAQKVISSALAAPPRNCDVGSWEEQYNRFVYCCTNRKITCRHIELGGCTKCYAKWSQMPYAKEGKE